MTDPASATVLVADNDPGVNGLLREVLGRSGLHTAAVEDGAAALAFIEGHRVSLLVCDLDMPKMGGEEVLEKLADRADSPPILVVSGYLDARVEARLAEHAHVRGVFRKPFDIFAFAETVVRIVGGGAVTSESSA